MKLTNSWEKIISKDGTEKDAIFLFLETDTAFTSNQQRMISDEQPAVVLLEKQLMFTIV